MSKREYYLKEIEKTSNELKRLLFDEKNWELKKDSKKNQCQVYCLPSGRGNDNYVWKGEALINMKPEQLIDMVHPTAKYRLVWDPNVASCRLLEELTPNIFITHTIMKSQLLGLLSARDTIDIFKLEETDQYISSQFSSIEYENAPSPPDCVRAWSYPSGIFFFKNGTNQAEPATKAVTFFQVDGRLDVVPPAMLNAAMPMFVKKYFKALRKSAEIQWAPLVDVPGRH